MLVQQRLSLPLYLAGSQHMRILGLLQQDLLMLECGRSILGLIQLRITLLCSSWQMLKTLTWRLSALLKLLSPRLPVNHIQSNLRDLSSLANNAEAGNSLDLGVRVTPFIHLQHIMSWFESNICSTIYPPKKILVCWQKIYYSWADRFWGQSLVYVRDAWREHEFCWNFADLSSFLVIWRVVMCFIVDYFVPWQSPSQSVGSFSILCLGIFPCEKQRCFLYVCQIKSPSVGTILYVNV